jgi:hypothetical protein
MAKTTKKQNRQPGIEAWMKPAPEYIVHLNEDIEWEGNQSARRRSC